MGTYKVDTEFVASIIPELKKLKTICDENAVKKFPVSAEDKGNVYNEIQTLGSNLISSWKDFSALIEKTIKFLTASSDTISENDSILQVNQKTGEVFEPHEAQIIALYEQKGKIDPFTMDQRINYTDANGKAIGYYVAENGCTWYAAARYRQVNGKENDLKFSSRGGNANNWVNSIDKSKFSVSDTNDYGNIKPNSIAVSTASDSNLGLGKDAGGSWVSASENHVCYIEAVRDGYVYYSQGSYGNAESTYGYINKVPIEIFAKDYESIITAL